MLVATPPPKGKKFSKQFKKSCAFVASKDTNLSIVTQDLRMQARSQGLRPMRKHILPLHPHPYLPSPVPTARKLDIRKNCVSRKEIK
jgi:hypothetical protein